VRQNIMLRIMWESRTIHLMAERKQRERKNELVLVIIFHLLHFFHLALQPNGQCHLHLGKVFPLQFLYNKPIISGNVLIETSGNVLYYLSGIFQSSQAEN
jgi:hypothetical protein